MVKQTRYPPGTTGQTTNSRVSSILYPKPQHKRSSIMKQSYSRATRTLLITLAMLATVIFAAQTALASTAENTVITNTVDVTYDDALGNAQPVESASASVTVLLVAAAPDVSTPANASTTQGGTVDLTYTITGNANGDDTYALSTVAAPNGVAAASIVFRNAGDTAAITDITLGGTTLAAATDGTATITVPYDGNNDGVVNGIAVGNTIDIGGVTYTVAAAGITETPATNTATITLTANVPAGTAAGSIVGEQATFILRLTAGNLTSAPTAGDYQVTTTGTGSGPAGSQAAATQVDVTLGALSVTKEVSADGGTTWGATANATPGTTLRYRITASNTGSGDATAVTVTDAVPQFTSYVANSTLLNGITVAGDGATSPLVGGLLVDDDGGRTAGAAATGVIQAGNSAVVTFEVTIN